MNSITSTDDAPFDKKGPRWHVVAWFLGIVVSVLVTYNATAATFDKRITVLESQREDSERRLQRIEEKLDRLLYRQ